MASPGDLPPGWQAHWDANYQRHVYVDTATGHSQWEHPSEAQGTGSPPMRADTASPTQAGAHASKRRHYAANQAQAYSGGEAPGYGDGVYGGQMGQPLQQQQPAQLFTPGLTSDNQFAAQQGQQPAYFQGQQPEYINGPNPGYGQQMQQPPYVSQQQQQVGQLAEQFNQMGMGGQKPYSLQTVNLMALPPDPLELSRPPPEVRLPPNSCLSNSPFALPDPSYQRCTLNAVPTNNSVLSKSKLPFALVITPYKSLKEGEPEVPLVTDTVIARCRRCRGYINPFVTFIDGGNRWRCSMCNMSNETPQLFDWDQERNVAADRWQRAELNHAVVEYIAPTEYMVRPPQPPVYAFLLDISHSAVQSGMLATAARTLLENLDRIPNTDGRSKIAIIGFDTSLHFFSITPGSTEFTMLVVSDVDDVFLPKPQDLLLSLVEARAGLESLLGRFNEMFQGTHQAGSALGPAMQAAFKMITASGGKIMVLSSSLPSIGAGNLKNREDPKLLGTSKESSLLQSASNFYKTFAIDCSRSQVSVDMFLFSSSYTDIATLANLPHYTSGQTYFYPAFNAARSEDAVKFAHEFGEVLAMPLMYEAVIRVRATRGLRMSGFHGNFFVRSTDLLAMPAVPQDQSYTIEVAIDDPIQSPYVVLQTGVLHSTCTGERRIRVITSAFPVTSNMSEIFASADQIAIATYLANKSVERSLSSKLEDARDAITNKLTDILSTYKSTMTAAGGGASAQLAICENLRMLPLLALGLLKHVGIRQSTQIPSDLRAYAQALLTSLPHQLLIPYIHPSFYSLHNMPPECGTVGDRGVLLPLPHPPTSERLERHGLYLIEDGQTMFLWVGRDAVPQLIMDVFDLPNYETLRSGKTTLPLLENPFSQRVNAVVAKIREMRIGLYFPQLYVVKEDGEPPLRLWALSNLIQDRFEQLPSYQQYLNTLKEKVNAGSYA